MGLKELKVEGHIETVTVSVRYGLVCHLGGCAVARAHSQLQHVECAAVDALVSSILAFRLCLPQVIVTVVDVRVINRHHLIA